MKRGNITPNMNRVILQLITNIMMITVMQNKVLFSTRAICVDRACSIF